MSGVRVKGYGIKSKHIFLQFLSKLESSTFEPFRRRSRTKVYVALTAAAAAAAATAVRMWRLCLVLLASHQLVATIYNSPQGGRP